MRSLKTLVGFVLILGLLTLGVVGLDYLGAPVALQLAFAILLAGFGLITFGIAIMNRPSAGTILATAGAAIALFVAVRDVFSMTLDLLLFALVVFDVLVLFVLFGEIERTRPQRRHSETQARHAPNKKREDESSVQEAEAAAVKAALAATEEKKKAPTKKRTTSRKPASKPKQASKTAKRASTSASAAKRFTASKERTGGSFHLVNCTIAQRMDSSKRVNFATREAALQAGYKPCRVCNP